jgi:hypothetical protein
MSGAASSDEENVGLVGSGVGGWGWGGWLCGPVVHVPLGGSTEGARPSWRPTRHQDGSDSVTILPVAERVVRAIVAAPMASPAPVTIGSRLPGRIGIKSAAPNAVDTAPKVDDWNFRNNPVIPIFL